MDKISNKTKQKNERINFASKNDDDYDERNGKEAP